MTTCNEAALQAVADCRSFDFTLGFEQSILSILPSSLLIALAPWRLISLRKERRKTAAGITRGLKSCLYLILAGLQLALLIFRARQDAVRTATSLAEVSLRLVDAFVLLILSIAEDRQSIRPSSIINAYLAGSLLFDAAQVRTLWLIHEAVAFCALATASLGLKLALLVTEAQSKRQRLDQSYQGLTPEATSSPFSRGTFWWLRSLLWRGFRTPLKLEDMFGLEKSMSSDALESSFSDAWRRSSSYERYRLLRITISVLKGPLLAVVIPRLLQTAFTFSQPFLVAAVILHIEAVTKSPDSETSDFLKDEGYGLIGATALIFLGIAVSSAMYKHKTYRMITMARGGLISLIYEKTLRLESVKDGAGITLMSSDIESIAKGLENAHEIWASWVDTGISIYLLQRRVGFACLPPVAIVILCLFASGRIAKLMNGRQKQWIEAVQKRVSLTSKLLQGVKEYRMIGLLGSLGESIKQARHVEIKLAKKFLFVNSFMNVAANTPTFTSPVVTLVTFAFLRARGSGVSADFSSSNVFAALTIVGLMTSPLGLAFNAIPQMAVSLASLQRLETYLLREERKDYRLFEGLQRLEPGEMAELTREGQKLANIQAGAFAYTAVDPPVLTDINVSFQKRTLTLVSGSVGAGKSTLLKALIGEVHCQKGFVTLKDRSIAYCPQETWISNLSLRDNVLCGLPFDRKLYDTVIDACSLRADLKTLPDGDLTLLGPKATKVSGGQAQRICLARAVYARKSLLLLDDPLSGLDTKTEHAVAMNLLGPRGLLKDLGTAVVWATHATKYSVLAHQVIEISEKEISVSQKSHVNEEQSPMTPDTEEDEVDPDVDLPTSSATPSAEASESTAEARRISTRSLYRYYLNNVGSFNIIVFTFLVVTYAFFLRFPQVWVEYWINAVQGSTNLSRTNSIYGGVYAVFAVATMIMFWASLVWMFQKIVPKTARNLHHGLLKSLLCATFGFLSSTDSGSLLNRFSQDMTLIDIELPSYAITFTFTTATMIGQGLLIVASVYYVTPLIAVTLVFVYALQKLYVRTSSRVRLVDLEAKAPLYSHMLDTYSGLASIRAFGYENRFCEIQRKRLDDSQIAYYTLFCIQRWLNFTLSVIVGVIAVCLVGIATQVQNATTANAIGVALNNAITFSNALAQVIFAWTSLETSIGAITRIKSFTEDVPAEDVDEKSSSFPNDLAPGHICLDGVIAQYGSSAKKALNNVSLVIEPGSTLGLCGRSGSGKSSLIMSLLGMVPVSQGTISVNGVNISTLASDTLRSAFLVLPQAPVFLPTSVRSNINAMSSKTDMECIATLQKVGLWDVLLAREGLDTQLDEVTLSQGQLQLLCLARAILNREGKQIVILDEFSSGIDAKTEKDMVRIIGEEFVGLTIIAVAHRLSTIMDYDCVAVLDLGMIVEQGVPKELLEKEDGVFRQLWAQHQQLREE